MLSKAIALVGPEHAGAEKKLQQEHASKRIMSRRAEGLRWEALNSAYKKLANKMPQQKEEDKAATDKPEKKYINVQTHEEKTVECECEVDGGMGAALHRSSPTDVTMCVGGVCGRDHGDACGSSESESELECEVLKQLSCAVQAERSAAVTDEERERADRRGERLRGLVHRLEAKAWE